MSYLLRLVVPDRPGLLGAVATALGEAGIDIVSVDVLERSGGVAVDDIVVELPGDRVAVLARNSHAFVALRFAVARLGAVLVPINFARISRRNGIKVHALYAHQFAEIPGTKSPDTVTTLEEEKITAYFGAGLLYADERRADPLV